MLIISLIIHCVRINVFVQLMWNTWTFWWQLYCVYVFLCSIYVMFASCIVVAKRCYMLTLPIKIDWLIDWIWTKFNNAYTNVHLFHFLKPVKQISAYTDGVRTAWQIRVLWKWKQPKHHFFFKIPNVSGLNWNSVWRLLFMQRNNSKFLKPWLHHLERRSLKIKNVKELAKK